MLLYLYLSKVAEEGDINMADNNQKKDDNDDQKGGVNPLIPAAIGAVVGATVAAGAMAMQDPDNQAKVKDALGAAKDHAAGYLSDLQDQAEEKKEEIKDKVEDAAKKSEKKDEK